MSHTTDNTACTARVALYTSQAKLHCKYISIEHTMLFVQCRCYGNNSTALLKQVTQHTFLHSHKNWQKCTVIFFIRVYKAVQSHIKLNIYHNTRQHPCPCQKCLHWPSAENTGRESLLNYLSINHVPLMTLSVKDLN